MRNTLGAEKMKQHEDCIHALVRRFFESVYRDPAGCAKARNALAHGDIRSHPARCGTSTAGCGATSRGLPNSFSRYVRPETILALVQPALLQLRHHQRDEILKATPAPRCAPG